MNYITFLGLLAATLTTASFVPQVIKTVTTKSTRDISLAWCATLSFGMLMWLVYGFLISDLPLIIANLISLFMSSVVLVYKLRYK